MKKQTENKAPETPQGVEQIKPVRRSGDAEIYARGLMSMPVNEAPELAIKYVEYVSSKIGICGDLWFTCYTHYAQAILKLKCNDEYNDIKKHMGKSLKSNAWFKDHRNFV